MVIWRVQRINKSGFCLDQRRNTLISSFLIGAYILAIVALAGGGTGFLVYGLRAGDYFSGWLGAGPHPHRAVELLNYYQITSSRILLVNKGRAWSCAGLDTTLEYMLTL